MKILAAAIDFGTSKIVTMVGVSGGYHRCDIAGYGEATYDGVMAGKFNDPSRVAEAIATSIQRAEQSSGQRISEVYIGAPGEFVRIITRDVELELSEMRRIVDDDVDKVLENASRGLVVPGNEVAHRNPAYFIVDDGEKTMVPVGQKGKKLRSRVCYTAIDHGFIEPVTTWVSQAGVQVAGFMSSSLGEALLMLNPEDRDKQALLIDVGYLSTEIMGIEGDAVVQHSIVPMGSALMTVDLVYGLQVPMAAAEQVKRAYAFGVPSGPPIEVQSEGQSYSFAREDVRRVLEPRAEEIAEHIGSAVSRLDMQFSSRSTFYLSGGGFAMMRGGREFLSTMIHKSLRVTEPHAAKLNAPMYASSVGLMDMVFEKKERAIEPTAGSKFKDFFRRIFGG